VKRLLERLPAKASSAASSSVVKSFDRSLLLPTRNEGFSMPSQVNYVVMGGPIAQPGEEVSGSTAVVSRYLSIGHLWDNVRVIGGAYGGFARFSEKSGRFAFLSYRDPNLVGTLKIYDGSADSLSESEVSSEEILQAIVGTIGDMDGPLSPDQKGFESLLQHMSGETHAERQMHRSQILQASPEDFKQFADRLRKLRQSGSICVFGSQAALEAANKELPADRQLVLEPAIQGAKS
jgi:Zn-dependent M16 (insulinase) family peptidase